MMDDTLSSNSSVFYINPKPITTGENGYLTDLINNSTNNNFTAAISTHTPDGPGWVLTDEMQRYQNIVETSTKIIFAEMSLGIVTNTVCLAMLTRKTFSGQPCTVYLQALALADLMLSLVTFSIGIPTVDAALCEYEVYCYFFDCMSNFSMVASNWTTAILSVERMIAVTLPFKAKQLITTKKSNIAILIIFSCAFLFSLQDIILSDRNKCYDYCLVVYNDNEKVLPDVLTNIDISFIFWLPFGLIASTSTVMCVQLLRLKERRKSMTKATGKEHNMMTVVLILNAYFLATRLPHEIHKLLMIHEPYSLRSEAILSVLAAIMLTNTFINMFLYVISKAKFRRELKLMFTNGKSRNSKSSKYSGENDGVARISSSSSNYNSNSNRTGETLQYSTSF